MTTSERAEKLKAELSHRVNGAHRLARITHVLNIACMLFALFAAAAAVVYGFLPHSDPRVAAVLGLVPGGIAVLATQLKYGARSSWHYRKQYALQALLRRAEYEWGDPPTQADITAIASELSGLDSAMEEGWEKELGFDWSRFQR